MLQNVDVLTVLSLNASQEENRFPEMVIRDLEQYGGNGPLTSLLSVAEKISSEYYLLLGCDYPALKIEDVSKLLNSLTHDAEAICYGSYEQPEPLLCIYSSTLIGKIKSNFPQQNSLSLILRSAQVNYLPLPERIKSIDTQQSSIEFTSQ